MALIRSEKNVWCHMVSEEYFDRASGIRAPRPGQIACTIYDSKNAATEDLKGFVKALREGGHPDVSDYTDNTSRPRVEWTDANTGKRLYRWVTDLPFFHG